VNITVGSDSTLFDSGASGSVSDKTPPPGGLALPYARYVHALAKSRLRDHHLAEDAAQTVFMVLSGSAGVPSDDRALRAWLAETTRRVCGAIVRRESRRRRREEAAARRAPSTAESGSGDAEVVGLIRRMLAGLDDEDRRALEMRYLEGCSLREVGARLGLSIHAAAMRIGRAIEKVQRRLRERGAVVGPAALVAALSASSATASAGAFTALKLAVAATVAVAWVAGSWIDTGGGSPRDPYRAEETEEMAAPPSFRAPVTARLELPPSAATLPALPSLPDPLSARDAGEASRSIPDLPTPPAWKEPPSPPSFAHLQTASPAARFGTPGIPALPALPDLPLDPGNVLSLPPAGVQGSLPGIPPTLEGSRFAPAFQAVTLAETLAREAAQRAGSLGEQARDRVQEAVRSASGLTAFPFR
jgi:RNA polymerase sigma-70 factor (ECF subfamily)